MSRTPDPIWNYFEKSAKRKKDSVKTQQHYTAKCNYCETSISGQPKRMKNHLINQCSNVLLEVKMQYSLNLKG